MSSRVSFILAVLLLVIAAGLRLREITVLPPGLNESEINDIRIAETARQGRIEVFYDLGGVGREGLYEGLLAVVTGLVGGGLIGYRLLSVLGGLLLLALVYALVKRLFNSFTAVAALALLVFNMWSVLLARLIMRETLLPLLLTVVLLALTYVLIDRRRRPRLRRNMPFAILGLALGLGFYIHPTNFLITLVAMLFIVYMLLSRQPLTRRKLGFIGFAIVIMVVVAMPYVISSIRRPDLAGAGRLFSDFPATGAAALAALFDGLGGFFLFGDANPLYNLPQRPLLDLMSGLLLIIGIAVSIRHWRQPRFILPLIGLTVLLPPALLTEASPDWPQFAVLLPLVALFFGVGVNAIYHSLPRRAGRFVPLGLLLLVGFNANWVVRDLFNDWREVPGVATAYSGRLAALAHHLDTTAATTPSLVCTGTLRGSRPARQLTHAEVMTLMMHRQNTAVRYANCGTGMVITNGGEREQVILPQPGALTNMNEYFRGWLARGDWLDDPALPSQSVMLLQVAPELADTIGRFTTTSLVSYDPDAPGGAVSLYPPVRFGGNITFLGYEPIADRVYAPGDYVTLITYWRVDGAVPSDLRLFSHLLIDPSTIAAQSDTLSVLPARLQPRDIFIQMMFIRIPARMQDGSYPVSIGAYEDLSDIRLQVFDSENQPRGTRLFLGEIRVAG